MAKKSKEIEIPKDMLAHKLLDDYREHALVGKALISRGRIDQITSLNPVTLEGQSEIIYNVWLYRTAKWHWMVTKADEYFTITPTAPPAFAGVIAERHRLEGQIKAGLASAAQAVADYDLLKHDERKYREILDFFKHGKLGKEDKEGKRGPKEEHVLRSLYIDRVDAFTGEGYSMISMAKRWPTVISDFIKLKSEWEDVDTIKKELKVPQAEATVLKTKNELFREWMRLFFPDVQQRYVRIKNLLQAREKSMYAYREWLKPYVQRFKYIREAAEIDRVSSDMDNPLIFAHTPEAEIVSRLWMWKPIQPEEMAKPVILRGQGFEIDPYDDWVRKKCKILEKKYGVGIYADKKDMERRKADGEAVDDNYKLFVREKYKNWIGKTPPGVQSYKKEHTWAMHPAPMMDPRFLYYIFIDLDYNVKYKKGSQGPMILEDQYFHFNPFIISQNVLLLFLLELEAKKLQFEKEVDELLGTRKAEDVYRESIEKEFEDQEKRIKRLEEFGKAKKSVMKAGGSFRDSVEPIVRFFIKPGPYETQISQRIAKSFGDYSGPQIQDMINLIKETSYRISGQHP